MKESRFLTFLAIVIFWLANPTSASAVSLTFSYTGTVISGVGGAAFSAFNGDAVSLSYTFESSTSDTNASSTEGEYATITSFTLTIVGASTNTYTASSGDIDIFNNSSIFGGGDTYEVRSFALSGPDIDGFSVDNFYLGFEDSGAIFSSDALPTVQPTPADFDGGTNDMALFFGDSGGDGAFAITSIESAVVPLPGALWLFGSSLIGLVSIARRKKA